MRLRESQQDLADWIRAPEGVAKALAEEDRIAVDAAPGAALRRLQSLIRSDEVLDATGRLEIYANAYFHRILGVLESDYPVLVSALGDEAFHDLVTSYLLVEPSRHPSIRHVGLHLADFLSAHDAASGVRERAPWAADLAAFEWTRNDMFDAADGKLLERELLTSLAPEAFASLRLCLGPWVSFRSYVHPVDRLWSQGRRENGFSSTDVAGVLAREGSEGSNDPIVLLVWRKAERVFHRRLEPGEASALALLSLGTSFGELCEWAADEIGESEAPARSAGWLARWLEDGLLVAVEADD